MIFKDTWLDIKAAQEHDSTACNALEMFLLYQGVHALMRYRFTHWLYKHRMYFIVGLISQIACFFTLIEIHPGAQLGHDTLIDHGSGVVIGETTVVGDNCTIYQGVTLGGVGTKKGKYHPTLDNNVMVGAGVRILSAFEVGDNCIIAANAVLLKSLKDNVTVVRIPARPVKKDGVIISKNRRSPTLGEYEDMKYRLEQMEKEMALPKDALAEKNSVGGKGQCRQQGTAPTAEHNAVQQRGTGRIHGENMAGKKSEAPHVNIERNIVKQFRKETQRPFVKGLQDYKTIQDGDKVVVRISGGKDSMLLAKCLQQLKHQSDTELDLEFTVMDPGYHPDNRRMIQDSAALMNIPIRIFDADIPDIVADVDQSPCRLCTRMRQGYPYSHARELGCNKIALGHHFDDVIETILMGTLYGGQINIMMSKLHSTNLEGMELIRPLHYVKEEDILAWRPCSGLHFPQYACRFTRQIAREQAAGGMDGVSADIVHTSKRQGMRKLIRSLRENSPLVDSNIMKSVENINLGACLGYVVERIRHHFMDEYDES